MYNKDKTIYRTHILEPTCQVPKEWPLFAQNMLCERRFFSHWPLSIMKKHIINICNCIKFCYTRTYFCECTSRKRQMFFSNKSQKRQIITKVTPKSETFSNLFHEWRCNHSSFLILNFFVSICFDSAWNWDFFILIDQDLKFLA